MPWPASSPTPRRSSCTSEIGVDIIAFETDYPHSDSLWPDAPEVLLRCSARVPAAPTS